MYSLEIKYSCPLQNITDKPDWFRQKTSLPSALKWFIILIGSPLLHAVKINILTEQVL